MNRLYFLIFLLAAKAISAQPVIEYTDILPQFGFTYEVATAVGDFQPGSEGENQIWDFSDFNAEQTFIRSYSDPATVPGGNFFTNSTHALTINNNATNQFYTFNEDSVTLNGIALEIFDELFITTFTDPIRLYDFPVAYLQSFQETYSVQSSELSEEIGNLTSTVDGYGTVQLASESLDNVLRIKREGQVVSIQYDEEGNIVAQDTSSFLQYEYLTAGLTIPVATLDIDLETGMNSLTLWVSKPVNSVAEKEVSEFKLWPVPSTDGRLTLSFETKSPEVIRIFDLTGKEVYAARPQAQTASTITIDLQHCPAGVYLVQIETEGKVYTQKAVLQ